MRPTAPPALTTVAALTAVLATLAPLTTARAEPLNPLDFTALAAGAPVTLAAGAYTINTDTLEFRLGAATLYTGTLAPDNDVAVFAFNGLTVPADTTITVIGRRPCALLSWTTLTCGGSFIARGNNGSNGVANGGGAAGIGGGYGGGAGGNFNVLGLGGNAGAGIGGGLGGAYGSGVAGSSGGGGSFGFGVGNGLAYGNLLVRLEGGSGGGGGGGGGIASAFSSGGGGGAGGGGLELGAIASVVLAGGSINADGGAGGNPYTGAGGGGGGGSGGGVLIHSAAVSLPTALTTRGGTGGFGGPGAGGGGRVTIESLNDPGAAGINAGSGGSIGSFRTGLVATNLDFGDVAVGSSRTLGMLITNSGPAATTVNGRFPPANAGGPFTRVSATGIFSALHGGGVEIKAASYTFAPTSVGAYTQTLTFLSDGGNTTVTISGNGVDPVSPPTSCIADVGVAGGFIGHDGLLDNNDFIAFIDAFFNHTGCP